MSWFKRDKTSDEKLPTVESGDRRVRTEGLWQKCEGCRQIIWKKDLEDNWNVCPKCGVHSRIDDTVEYIRSHARVGNCYVNRNQIGAVVGVQPFGGESLSGTGPKAGGPHYLLRFAGERTLTINTTAAGGNASLLTIGE